MGVKPPKQLLPGHVSPLEDFLSILVLVTAAKIGNFHPFCLIRIVTRAKPECEYPPNGDTAVIKDSNNNLTWASTLAQVLAFDML